MGLYHTSIMVHGNEFSYGGHAMERSGIVVVQEGDSAGLVLKESLPIGYTYYGSDEMDEAIEYFGDFWRGCDYDPFSKNCNHFTEALASYLCEKNVLYYPSYINRFCKLGSILRMWFRPLQDLWGELIEYNEFEDILNVDELLDIEAGDTSHLDKVKMLLSPHAEQVHGNP